MSIGLRIISVGFLATTIFLESCGIASKSIDNGFAYFMGGLATLVLGVFGLMLANLGDKVKQSRKEVRAAVDRLVEEWDE